MEIIVRHTSKYCDISQINAYKTFIPVPGTLILAFIESLPRPCQSGEDRQENDSSPRREIPFSPSSLIAGKGGPDGGSPGPKRQQQPSSSTTHGICSLPNAPPKKHPVHVKCLSNFISGASAP